MTDRQTQPTAGHYRLNIAGFHIGLSLGGSIRGIAIWPPGVWPKTPWLYRFYDRKWNLLDCCK